MILEKEFLMRVINNSQNLGRTAIKPQDLGVRAYREAYQELLRQLQAGMKPDLMSVATGCKEHQQILFEMSSVIRDNFEYYEKKLAEDIHRRRLYVIQEEFLVSLGSERVPSEIVAGLEKMISRSWVSVKNESARSFHDIAQEYMPILKERYELKGKIPGIDTGFPSLNGVTGGFKPGTYYIGARPSQGKTALMLTMMRAVMAAGHSAGLISNESGYIELFERALSAEAKVFAKTLQLGDISKNDLGKLDGALARFKEYKSAIYYNTKIDLQTLEAEARKMVETQKVEVIFVDYLQRFYADGATKFQQVANASRTVTDIAKGLGVPVVCLAQTGRQADHEAPTLNHFQHSSAIEQDADVAIIIDPPDPSGTDDIWNLCVLKNRNGGTITIKALFNKGKLYFEEWTRD